jgi:hypothetical protein
MKMSDAFPSKYLKADVDVPDADQGGIVLTISYVEMADVGSLDSPDSKPVVFFEEVSKGLVLNKTNAATLTTLFHDDDTDVWAGKRVKLVAKDVEFQGKMTRGIRVSTRPVPAAPAPPLRGGPVKPPGKQAASTSQNDTDDIPF